jgi:hypothetical protein
MLDTRTKPGSVSEELKEQDRAFRDVFNAAKKARASIKTRPHRALTPLTLTPYLRLQAILLPLLLCGLLYAAKPLLFDLWRQTILFWSTGLHLPFSLASRLNESGQYGLQLPGDLDGGQWPARTTLIVTAVVTVLSFAASFRMTRATFPLKYPVQIICVIQFVALLYFWWTPATFPYNIARHSEELLTIGYVVILIAPVMLAMGYYILNLSLWRKLLNTLLILGFLMVLVPFQVLAQAMFLQHFSILLMPVLYICFGAIFDTLVFVALYSWVASNVPSDATV